MGTLKMGGSKGPRQVRSRKAHPLAAVVHQAAEVAHTVTERIVEVEKIIHVEGPIQEIVKYVEVPVEVIREVIKEVQVVQEVKVPFEVIKEVIVEKVVQLPAVIEIQRVEIPLEVIRIVRTTQMPKWAFFTLLALSGLCAYLLIK